MHFVQYIYVLPIPRATDLESLNHTYIYPILFPPFCMVLCPFMAVAKQIET